MEAVGEHSSVVEEVFCISKALGSIPRPKHEQQTTKGLPSNVGTLLTEAQNFTIFPYNSLN